MENENLWAPWRSEYIQGLEATDQKPKGDGTFLSEAVSHPEQDEQRLVLHRSDHSIAMLNRYPYTGGHMLVAPKRAVADLMQMSKEERHDLFDLVALTEEAVHLAFNPQGINIGINIGRAAGAGVPQHLHVHVVPRWSGDVNFMSVVGQVRVVPLANEKIFRDLQTAFAKLSNEKEA